MNVCECGISSNPPNYKNHLKSKKHIDTHMELSRYSMNWEMVNVIMNLVAGLLQNYL